METDVGKPMLPQQLVTMYLDCAEYQASRHVPVTMRDWSQRLNRFLEFNGCETLHDTGRATHEIAKAFAGSTSTAGR